MTLVKCPNGHYYDSSRFGNNCPHCGMSGAASIGADQTTVPLNIPDAPQPANEVTEPLTVSQPVVSQPARWNAFYNWLNGNQLVETAIPENTGFSNDYLPQ